MSTVCESSPWRNEQERSEAKAQWQIMAELHLDVWDPANQEAAAKLKEILANLSSIPTSLAKKQG